MTTKLTEVSYTYLELSQASMMKFFAKTANGFCKKAPSKIRDWVV